MYAIIESGGKQYRAEKGTTLVVDRLKADEGAKVNLRAVMFAGDDDVVLGGTDLEKVKVEAKVAGHERGEKIRIFKYKAKKGYRKRAGHRSELTRLEVTEVTMLSRKPAKAAEKQEAGGSKPDAETAAAEVEAQKPAQATKPAAKKPAPKKPAAAKKPAAEKKPAAKPAAKKPAAKKPAAKKPAAKKTSTEKES